MLWSDSVFMNQQLVVVQCNTAGEDKVEGWNPLYLLLWPYKLISCVFLLCLAPGCELDWPH